MKRLKRSKNRAVLYFSNFDIDFTTSIQDNVINKVVMRKKAADSKLAAVDVNPPIGSTSSGSRAPIFLAMFLTVTKVEGSKSDFKVRADARIWNKNEIKALIPMRNPWSS